MLAGEGDVSASATRSIPSGAAASSRARPATGVPHSFRAGDGGLTYLAYGTREPSDIAYYPAPREVSLRGVGVRFRVPRELALGAQSAAPLSPPTCQCSGERKSERQEQLADEDHLLRQAVVELRRTAPRGTSSSCFHDVAVDRHELVEALGGEVLEAAPVEVLVARHPAERALDADRAGRWRARRST